MTKTDKIKDCLRKLPDSPGIYKMLNKEGQVIYIGKAKNLKKRVKQYFKKNYEHSTRTKKLIEKVDDIKITAVDSELEAIILEHNQIKLLQPKYNVIMKDDKNYVYIKITKEDFPRIQIVREIKKDKAKYIGPKTAAHKVRETFKVIKRVFPFRHCSLNIEELEDKGIKVTNRTIKFPCLDYHIKRCAGPCIEKCSKEEYGAIIKSVEDFLEGKADNILKDLNGKMKKYAINREFEKAAKTRDRISKITDILEKQKVSDPNQSDKDIINYVITHERAYFNLFQIRGGKLIGQENFILSATDAEDKKEEIEVLQAFINQYYSLATDIPQEIIVPHKIEELPININSKIIVPKIGTKNKLLNMSLKNAIIYADRNRTSWQEENPLNEKAAKELQELLKIKTTLKRIECYDISHLGGTDTVGSMVVFEKGAPKNKMYRKFKIKTIKNKPDDYKSMKEVLTRRLQKIAEKVHQKDYEFKKMRKKDFDIIQKHTKIDISETKREFYILEKIGKKKKTVVGFIAKTEYSNKVAEITNLWLDPKERGKKLGYKLIKNIINKVKSKRVYGLCKQELLEYYLMTGFEEIKKIPDEMEHRVKEVKKVRKIKKPIPIVYDKYKHQTDESFSKIPDLLVIDGGKGQLKVATEVLEELKLKIPHISLAKRLEEIFEPGKSTSILLEKNNDALRLLQRARDEAHRFAINFNRNLRSKKFKKR